jgi:mRNA-degrading endonuclease RelE of RelBE toxin-antitoxin system
MWTVKVHRKVAKKLKLKTFPISVKKAIEHLIFDLRIGGAIARNWPNYGKLGGNKHHCHLKKGKPTYVAIWSEVREETQTIEVTYVGTHEKAPY